MHNIHIYKSPSSSKRLHKHKIEKEILNYYLLNVNTLVIFMSIFGYELESMIEMIMFMISLDMNRQFGGHIWPK